MSVYTIFDDLGDKQRCVKELLDGDFKKVVPIGYEFHPVMKAAKQSDGTWIEESFGYQGIPVDLSSLPTKLRWVGNKHELNDLQKTHDWYFISSKLKEIIENLESNRHQFHPVEIFWEDNTHAANFYWFNPCNRIDAIDREHSTALFNEKIGMWKYEGGSFVVNLEQVHGNHIWVDSRARFNSVWVTDQFKQAIVAADINGIGFAEFETVGQ